QTLANSTIVSGGTIYFTPGLTYRIATATTTPLGVASQIPQNTTLKADGVVVTIQGTIQAGLWPIFATVNGGSFIFGSANVQSATKRVLGNTEIYPEWWGATADGSHDDTAAINAAIAATTGLPTSGASTTRYAGPKVRLSAGVYKVTDAIQVTDTIGVHLEGAGQGNTYINFAGGTTGTAT